jgi:tRNA nucleotidyltransferase (CCA-adding enzyme)
MEVITCHTNADFDTFASMIAAGKLYPKARLVVPGSLEKALRDALKTMSLDFKFDRVSDIDLDKVTRLILVDIKHKARIGALGELVGKKGVEIHIYDHHPATKGDIKGSLSVTGDYGSTTSIITLIIKERSIELTPEEATLFMAGIYEDTGFLSFPSTRVKDYEAAAFLLENGADLKQVSKLLKSAMTSEEVAMLNRFIESERVYSLGGVNISVAAASIDDYSGEVAELAMRLAEVDSHEALFLLAGSGDRIHLVIRSSSPDIDAGRIAESFGGGGHPNAASATLKGLTLIQAAEAVVSSVKLDISSNKTAVDIMSAPPITVTVETTIARAREVLLNFNVNAMPVVEGGIIKGVITRQVVGKAIFHKLGASQVRDFMTTDFDSFDPKSSIENIREKVFFFGQRLLPVCKGKKVVGVITRTDLLRLLQEELIDTPERSEKVVKNRNLANVMRERLPDNIFSLLEEAGQVADSLGFKAYAVGGFVRDLVMRRSNLDIDVVIEGNGIEFARKFGKLKNAKVRTHSRFKTAAVMLPDGNHVDVATARLEYYDSPGALPTVELSSLKLDLYRRDFTINTLALDILPKSFGTLIDFFGALGDIKEKSIRTIHNLSFVEDPTRILRAVRFSERFGFRISPQTTNHMKNTLKLDIFAGVSGPRLADELKNILEEDIVVEAVSKLHSLGVLAHIDPKIKWDAELAALFGRARETLAWYRLLYTDKKVEVWLILFLALTDSLKETELKRLTARLGITGKKKTSVIEGRRAGLKALKIIEREPGANIMMSEVYHLLKPLPTEVVLYLMEKTKVEAARKRISDFFTKLSLMDTALKGAGLKKLGVRQGPQMGKVLGLLLDKRLNDEISTKAEEVKFVKGYLNSGK